MSRELSGELIRELDRKLSRLFQMVLLGLTFLLVGCSGPGFNLKNLAKTDIDMVADAHYQEVELLLKELTIKLYKRNPKCLAAQKDIGRVHTVDTRVDQLFSFRERRSFPELSVSGVDAIERALSNDFDGDRVFALMVGLTTMIRQSYNDQSEFFIYSELDGQQLYYSARNLEIALWRISTYRDDHGAPFLLTNSMNGKVHNLSYERLFGKMIALQDILAKIIADKNQRFIKTVAQNVATMAFFPI